MRPISPTRKRLEVTAIVSQSQRTGRRSYKMMPLIEVETSRTPRVRKEPVWPPLCEEALLEGLRAYRPVSKTGRPLRRFTKRNVFISSYILQKTGKKRTPKQVGSRLQQISESSRDDNLKTLIRNRNFLPDQTSDQKRGSLSPDPCSPTTTTAINTPSENTDSTLSDPGSPEALLPHLFDESDDSADATTVDTPPFYPPTCLDDPGVTLSRYHNPSTSSVSLLVELLSSEATNGLAAQFGLDADITDSGIDFIFSFDTNQNAGDLDPCYTSNARRLTDIPPESLFYQSPQLTIISSFLSSQNSYFCTFGVYLDATTLVHSEDTTLTITQAPAEYPSKSCILCAPFLPGYWNKLSRSPSLERYTITFGIAKLPVNPPNFVHGKPDFSVALNFKSTSPHDVADPPSYTNAAFGDQPLPPTFSNVPLCNILGSSTRDVDCGRGIYTCFDPSSSYTPYPLVADQLMYSPDSDISARYAFAQF